jgi:hypothetical protein
MYSKTKLISFVSCLLFTFTCIKAQIREAHEGGQTDFGKMPFQEIAIAGSQKTQATAVDDYPQWALYFLWDGLAWDSSLQRTYTYRPDGEIAEYIQTSIDTAAPHPITKVSLDYDAANRIIQASETYWDGSSWLPFNDNVYQFDSHGNRTAVFNKSWNGLGWDTLNGSWRTATISYTLGGLVDSMETEHYDATLQQWNLNGRLVQRFSPDSLLTYQRRAFFDQNSMNWVDFVLKTYHFNANQAWDTLEYYVGNVGTPLAHRSTTIWSAWHNFEKQLPLQYEEYTYQTTDTLHYRFHSTYGAFDSNVQYEEYFYQGAWDSTAIREADFDTMGNNTRQETFFPFSGTWMINYGQRHHWTYDAQWHTVEEWHETKSLGSPYIPAFRWLYAQFFTSAPDPTSSNVDLVVYPNPCTDQLNFRVEGVQGQTVQITLYDMQGRLRMQSFAQLNGGEVKIDLSESLESGTYCYRFSTGKRTTSGKIVVTH